MSSWDPAQYERFADHRSRPFVELLARVAAESPRLVVDLGCGNGPLTLLAAQRWPDARVIGVDSSPDMLARARSLDTSGRVEWQQADIADYHLGAAGPPDVVLSNAALQWVPTHRELIPTWLQALAPGGWFAMQVPGNFEAPSHRLIRDAAAQHPRRDDLMPLLRADPVGEPAQYADLLATGCDHPDVWETCYLQILDPDAAQRHPVLEWVTGTALRPLLDALPAADHPEFLADLARRYAAAYPRRPYGVPFAFRRIFAVGQRSRRPKSVTSPAVSRFSAPA
jgi:trans-aconitate 2-methyltransferase